MRILVVNSNTSCAIRDLIADEARAASAATTEIVATTASLGPASIESRTEGLIAAYGTLAALSEHANGCDAAVIACFSDPGLFAARELLPIPVVGIAEAAMLSACMLGARFGILTIGNRLEPVIWDLIKLYGLTDRVSGIRTLERSVIEVGENQQALESAFVKLANQAIEEDGAEVLILGGAAMSGMVRRIASQVPVPLLDGVACAIRQAELLVTLDLTKARVGSFATPAPKALSHVPDHLQRRFRPNR